MHKVDMFVRITVYLIFAIALLYFIYMGLARVSGFTGAASDACVPQEISLST